jgi:RNA polymerase sigma-70 factor (ECF subfamily)
MSATLENVNVDGLGVDASEAPMIQSNIAERDLVRRLQEGSEIAYREFVERYQSDVYRVAYGIIGRRDYADEVAQQVFVKAYFSIKRFDGRSSLYAWVYRTAINESYSFLRVKPRDISYSENSTGQHAVPDEIGSSRDFLNKLLDRIPEENRYVLLLRQLEGYSLTHLAETTGLNEKTIKVKLLGTRQALAKAARQHRCTS